MSVINLIVGANRVHSCTYDGRSLNTFSMRMLLHLSNKSLWEHKVVRSRRIYMIKTVPACS